MEGSSGESGPTGEGAPRWVRVWTLVAAIAIAVLVLVALLTGGSGGHGPGRHVPDGSAPDAREVAAQPPEAVAVTR